jgi:hypothetical protein
MNSNGCSITWHLVEYEPTVSDYWNTMPTEEPKRKSEN